VEVQVLSSASSRPLGGGFPFAVCDRIDAVRRKLYSGGEHTFVTAHRHTESTTKGAQVLTARQQEIWNYLIEYVDRHGYPPTVREIGEQVGLASPSTVHAHLANLERAGLLRRDPTKPRALELIGRERAQVASVTQADEQRDVARLPLVGEIAAGGPMLAEQNIEEYIAMPASTKGDFLLRVKGESMVEAGILDGDLVIVQQAQDARNGEIVVALAGDDESADEATVKTFYRESNRIRLQPENSALEPIYAQHVQIIGRVVGVFREL
jgi:repressor LexA